MSSSPMRAGGFRAEIARRVFQFQADLFDEFLFQFLEIFFAALDDQLAFLLA